MLQKQLKKEPEQASGGTPGAANGSERARLAAEKAKKALAGIDSAIDRAAEMQREREAERERQRARDLERFRRSRNSCGC